MIATVLVTTALWSYGSVAADRQNGQQIYELHCLACHGEEGRALDPATPSFADGDGLFVMDSELLDRIRDGSATNPSFRGILSDSEIRDVISYLRTL